jgi:hypothetical protein
MRVLIELLDSPGVEARRTAFDAAHNVTVAERQFGDIRPVLAAAADIRAARGLFTIVASSQAV